MTATTSIATTAAHVDPNQDRLAASAEHMCAAESFLHTARQAGIDEWISLACQHLHEATVEHEVQLLLASFPRVPARIVAAVLEAYLTVTHSLSDAIQSTRDRLADAILVPVAA